MTFLSNEIGESILSKLGELNDNVVVGFEKMADTMDRITKVLEERLPPK